MGWSHGSRWDRVPFVSAFFMASFSECCDITTTHQPLPCVATFDGPGSFLAFSHVILTPAL